MAKYIFSGLLPGFVKSIHIKLPDETVNVPVPEVFG